MNGNLIKNFREKVLSLKEKVSDKDFFASVQCHAYLQNLAEAITKKYNHNIKLHITWGEPEGVIAYATDRNELFLNVNNPFFNDSDGRVNKLIILKGLILHECGHLLFTDFHLKNSAIKVFSDNRRLFPEPKCEEYQKWMSDAVQFSDSELHDWIQIWKHLENAIEDGFIESMILKKVPGDGQCLYPLRNKQKEEFKSIKAYRNDGLDNPSILFNCILSLAKYSTIKMDADDKNDEAIKELLKNYNLIQEAVHTQKSYDRMKLINTVFCKLYRYMKEEKEKEESSQNQSNDSESSDTTSSSGEKSPQNDKDESSNSPDENHDNSSNNSTESDSDSPDPEQDAESNDSESSDTTSSSGEKSPQNDKDESSNSPDENCDNSSGDSSESDSDSSDPEQNAGTNDNNSLPSPGNLLSNVTDTTIKDDLDTNAGSVLNDSNISENEVPDNLTNNQDKLSQMQKEEQNTAQIPSPSDMRETDSITESIAKDRVSDEIEKELAEKRANEAKSFDYTGYNKGIRTNLVRKEPTPNAERIYNSDMQDIGFLSKKMVNEIRNKIKDQQQGGKINGLYQGRYLDQHSLSRFDCRCLCKNDLPEDIPDMAIGVLLDMSGSMNCDDKYVYARRTALLLYEFGRQLNVPIMVYAHNSYGSTNDMYDLADFDSVDGKDRYRICDVTSGGGNRDGMALRFCSDKLSKRKEQNKFMFVISDGLPSAYNSRQDGNNDIKGVLMDYSKKNVKYVAVGLGSDQKQIEELYTQDLSSKVAAKFLQCEDPKELPVTVVRVIKQLIKIK